MELDRLRRRITTRVISMLQGAQFRFRESCASKVLKTGSTEGVPYCPLTPGQQDSLVALCKKSIRPSKLSFHVNLPQWPG